MHNNILAKFPSSRSDLRNLAERKDMFTLRPCRLLAQNFETGCAVIIKTARDSARAKLCQDAEWHTLREALISYASSSFTVYCLVELHDNGAVKWFKLPQLDDQYRIFFRMHLGSPISMQSKSSVLAPVSRAPLGSYRVPLSRPMRPPRPRRRLTTSFTVAEARPGCIGDTSSAPLPNSEIYMD